MPGKAMEDAVARLANASVFSTLEVTMLFKERATSIPFLRGEQADPMASVLFY